MITLMVGLTIFALGFMSGVVVVVVAAYRYAERLRRQPQAPVIVDGRPMSEEQLSALVDQILKQHLS